MAKLILLGGTRETEHAATALQARGHAVAVYWSRPPEDDALARCASLRDGLAWADGLLDITHAFDSDLRSVARAIAPELAACRYGRAQWEPEPGDRWRCVPDIAQAVAALPAGARVFAATGRDSADVLAHHDGPVFLRQLHRHDDPAPPNCVYVFGTGPFAQADEMRLFQELRIDALVARNIGGTGSYPKIAAARACALPVILLEPDTRAFGPTLTSLERVLDWAGTL